MFKGGSERIVSIEMQEYPAEIEQGNVEYKLKLLNKTNERIDQLTSQLKWRLQEGNGQAIYQIGVADCGEKIGLNQKGIILANASEMSDSIKTLINMTKRINAQAHTIKTREVRKGFLISEVQIRKLENTKFTEIRVAILGGADAGKSTLISMLCFNEKDDGKGKARLNLLRHRHEIESGRSSSLARQIIGFSATGNMINYSSNRISRFPKLIQLGKYWGTVEQDNYVHGYLWTSKVRTNHNRRIDR
jgi:GTPase